MSTSLRFPRRTRGYALAIVLLVSVLFSVALTSMFFALASASKLTAQSLAQRRAQYLCDGVVELANQEIRRMLRPPARNPRTGLSPPLVQLSIEQLNRGLDPLRAGVRRDGITINALEVDLSGSEGRLSVVPSGGLQGTEIRVADLNLLVNLSQGDGPPCNARQVHPLATISIFQFPALSVSRLAARQPSGARWDFPNRFVYGWGRNGAEFELDDPLKNGPQPRSASTAALTLPAAPATDPPTTPNGMHFWTEAPLAGERAPTRAALEADLRILDGEWYVNDGTYPGKRIWSDHPCGDARDAVACSNVVGSGAGRDFADDSLAVRRLYSRYERNKHGFLDATLPSLGVGVVSYGAVTGGNGADAHDPAGFLSASVCASASAGTFARPSACLALAGGVGGPKGALADVSRSGFVDDTHLHMPMNIDLAALAAAFQTRTNGELGTELCLPRSRFDTGGCSRVFNGLVYVSASHGTAPEVSPVAVDVVPADGRAGTKLPWPLCGSIARDQNSLDAGEDAGGVFTSTHVNGCDDADYAKIDSVRLLRASNLAAFAVTGLTVVTDLPLYVVGDVNRTGRNARVALVADRVNAFSVAYSDRERPLFGSGVGAPGFGGSRNVVWQTSILSGTPPTAATPPEANGDILDLVRVADPVNFAVDITGALAVGWASEDVPLSRPPLRLDWTYPEQLMSAVDTEHPPKAPRATFLLPGARR